jgi:hypothetical protein
MSPGLVLLLILLCLGAFFFVLFRMASRQTDVPSKYPAPCPVCGGKSICQMGKTYECTNCHSTLKLTFTPRALWSIPVLLGMVALMLLTVPLRRAGLLTGVWLAAAVGGLGSLGFSLSMQAFIRGMVYRLAQSPTDSK